MATHFGQIADFNPNQDNWDNYVESLNFFFAANGITDANKKRAIMLSSCGAVTYKLFKGLTAPSKTSEVSFDNLCNLMSAHKHITPNPIADRFRPITRNRESTESFDSLCKLMSVHKHLTPNPIADKFRSNTRNRESTDSVATYSKTLQRRT